MDGKTFNKIQLEKARLQNLYFAGTINQNSYLEGLKEIAKNNKVNNIDIFV